MVVSRHCLVFQLFQRCDNGEEQEKEIEQYDSNSNLTGESP